MGNIICYFFLWQHWNFILPGLPFRTFCNMWNFQDSSQKHVYTDILHNLVNSCWKVVISLSANPMYLKVVLHCKHHNNDDSNKVNKQLVLSAKQQLCTWVIVFSTFLSCPLHDCDTKPPNAMFYGWCEHTTTNFPSSFWTWLSPYKFNCRKNSPHLTNWVGPNRHNKVWKDTNSFSYQYFHSRHHALLLKLCNISLSGGVSVTVRVWSNKVPTVVVFTKNFV